VPRRDPDSFVREVTERIAEARRQAGLTQEAAAQRYGMALKNWQRIEAGQNLTLHTLARVAITLGAAPEELVSGGQAMAANPSAAPGRRKAKAKVRSSVKRVRLGAKRSSRKS
jgi:transcriptional regulator with XRE-family HTH domain